MCAQRQTPVTRWGYWDKQVTWDKILEGKDYSKGLIVEALDVNAWKCETATFSANRASSVFVFVEAWTKRRNDNEIGAVQARMICELMAPNLPATNLASRQEASAELRAVVEFILLNWRTNYSDAIIDAGIKEVLGGAADYSSMFTSQACTDLIAGATDDLRVAFLRVVAFVRNITGKTVLLEQAVLLLVSVAKQGTVSEGFLTKIVEGMQDDLGKVVNPTAEEIKTCWNAFGKYVNDENVEEIIARWIGFLPDMALRLRLTLQQIPGEGLTSIMAIHKAIKTFPTFRWDVINIYFPEEVAKMKDALQAVDGKPFYGYKKDLGIVKSTNFPSIAYVAKELLVRIQGDRDLNRARCWKKPARKADLDLLIAKFEDENRDETEKALEQAQTTPDFVNMVDNTGAFYG